MITIKSHPRGIAISDDEGGIANNPLVDQLEERLGEEQAISYRGALIFPTRLAADVLELFNPAATCWEENLLKQARAQSAHRLMQLRARVEVAQALEDPRSFLAGYDLLPKLDPHQAEAVAAITVPSLKGLALFDEQGTGKTIMALAAFDRLRQLQKVRRLIVVAPKSVLGSWRSQSESFLGCKYTVVMVDGTPSERRKAIRRLHDILLISYDSAILERGLLKMTVAASPATYMLVVDESYFVKNPKTARSKVVSEIRPYCDRAVILCGTPVPNAATDIVNQIDIADGGVAFTGASLPRDREEAQAEIAKALGNAIYLRRLKEEVFPNIPKKQIDRVILELQPVQQKMYDRARDELIIDVRSVNAHDFKRRLSSFLARRVVLLQICSNPKQLDPSYAEEPVKLLALDRLLHEIVECQNGKAVVWSYFRGSLQAIAERYEHLGLARIDGSVLSTEDRVKAIERFQNDHTIRLFVGNAAAAGAGITLTAAHHAIYESFSNQAAHYMQSVDRIHRRGQTHDVTYHVLITRNTIEGREFSRILKKERAGRTLLGDKYDETMTRERFLAELENT